MPVYQQADAPDAAMYGLFCELQYRGCRGRYFTTPVRGKRFRLFCFAYLNILAIATLSDSHTIVVRLYVRCCQVFYFYFLVLGLFAHFRRCTECTTLT